ncbi:unnamed protein product [Durusdinium trenchii]|uniref:Uncharacterized protein n=1 Tax=Durusdinium trenchii TaxID=1381693 RepID=A0ABP0H980_9DINO
MVKDGRLSLRLGLLTSPNRWRWAGGVTRAGTLADEAGSSAQKCTVLSARSVAPPMGSVASTRSSTSATVNFSRVVPEAEKSPVSVNTWLEESQELPSEKNSVMSEDEVSTSPVHGRRCRSAPVHMRIHKVQGLKVPFQITKEEQWAVEEDPMSPVQSMEHRSHAKKGLAHCATSYARMQKKRVTGLLG